MSRVQTFETDSRNMSQAVIDVIAAVEGTPPTELTPPLNDVVDPEALDKLSAGKASLGKVVFNYNSYEVRVEADGYVAIKDHTAVSDESVSEGEEFNRAMRSESGVLDGDHGE